MYRWILGLAACASALTAGDDPRLDLAFKAQVQFDHVELAVTPDLRDTLACVQTQAGLLPVATADELPAVHYHKGFCTLAGATITHRANEFADAAGEFEKTIETWPGRPRHDKNKSPEPLSPAVNVLASLARLNAGWDESTLYREQSQLTTYTQNAACATGMVTPGFCQDVLQAGRVWLGWMALRHDLLNEAAPYFAGSSRTGWPEWVRGRQAFAARQYSEAARLYQQSIEMQKREPASMLGRLGPRADLPAELADLGGALLLAGNRTAAIAALDEAVKDEPSNAHALYLRARTKELSHQMDAALTD